MTTKLWLQYTCDTVTASKQQYLALQLIDRLGTTTVVLLGHVILVARPVTFYFFSSFFIRLKALAIATECLQG